MRRHSTKRRLLRDTRPLYCLIILLLPFASEGYGADWTAWHSIYDAAGGGIEYSIRPTNSVVDGDRMYYLRFRSRYDHPVNAEIVIYKRMANGTTSNSGGSGTYTFNPAKGNIVQDPGAWYYAIEIMPKVIRVFTDDKTSTPLVGELKFPGKASAVPSTAQEDPISKCCTAERWNNGSGCCAGRPRSPKCYIP